MNIEQRPVGSTSPALVIAEIGVNHDGSLARALQLVEAARVAGADAVKLQIFTARSLMHASAKFAVYQKDRCRDADPSEMLRRFELCAGDIAAIVQATRDAGMIPLATPFSPDDVRLIASLGLPAVKIASPDLVNRPLLEAVARLGLPMLLSTGAATMEEAAVAVGWLRGWLASFSLLHCVSSYPTPAAMANLCWIGELRQAFDVPVGFSDHTIDVWTGALAVSAGATIIEKHLTYDRSAAGPDHSASADPAQFKEYVRLIRQAEQYRGTPGKRVLEIEEDVRRVSRQSLVTTRDLCAGAALSADALTVQRPGTGIPASALPRTLGRRTTQAVAAGTLLQWEMLTDAA